MHPPVRSKALPPGLLRSLFAGFFLLALLELSFAQPAAGQTVAFVRSAGGFAESVPYTINISPAAGNFLVVFVWQIEGAATPAAMTDNRGNVYTQDCNLTYNQGFVGNRRLTVYHLQNAPSGITGVNITPNKPSRGIVAEYSGMPASGAVFDLCGAVNNQSTAAISWTSTATTTTANDLIFGLADTGSSGNAGYSASGSWTGRAAQHDSIDVDDSYFADRISVAAGSYTATGTTTASVRESSVVVAFKTSTGVAPVITSANSATFTAGTAATFTLTATGVPVPTLSETGALPAGLAFNAATGALSGTPAANGSYPITFTAQNGVAPAATQSFTLAVNPAPVAPVITSANSATFTVGAAGTFNLTATGVPTPTLSRTGTLPAGVTFTAATGTLTGTPAASVGGSYPMTFTAQNGVGANATQTFTLTVSQPAAITSTSNAAFTVGAAGSFTLAATGFPTPIVSESGALPAGITFNAVTGVLGGTPAAGAGGSYPVTFTAQNGVGADATQSFTLTVNQAATITSTNNTTFTVGAAGSFALTANGSPAPALSESGALPSGVTFTAATGTLAGTPAAAAAGSYPITFSAQNGVGANATQTFTLTVNQTTAITSANNAAFTVGAAGSFTLTTNGFPAPALSASGALPSGVTFTAATGTLAGTPAAGAGGSYPMTFTAQNGVGANATQTFTLTVNEATAITSANNATFTVGAAGSFTLTANSFPTPALSASGALPWGVTFTAATGTIAGTPAAGTAGSYPITFTSQNGVGTNATQSFTLTVNQASAITSANNAAFTVGTAGSFTVTANGFPAPTLSASGALPSGVTFAAVTGTLAGTPAAAGSYPITFAAQNGVATDATQTFTLTVNQPAAIAGGYNSMGPTSNVRYVSGNGNNTSDGLSSAAGKGDVYSALVEMTNSTPGSSGGVVNLFQNSADAGMVRAQPEGLLGSHTTGGIWIMGSGDPNFVRISNATRAGNVVTIVARSAIPTSGYYQVGRTISVFALSDASFDGNFVIASVSGTVFTYNQAGADTSVSGANGVVTPLGWIPQNNRGYDFRGQAGASGLGTGGAGAVTGLIAGQQYSGSPTPITSASQAGSTVTVAVAVSTKTWVGLPVKIAGVPTAGYNGTFIVSSAPTNTTFTYEAPTSGLAPAASGLAMIELPSIWLSGVSDITFRDIGVSGPLPLLIGVDSNMSVISSAALANLHFIDCDFAVQFNSSPLPGPATWIGSNTLWIYFDHCLWEANKTALVTSDERAAVLMKATGGATSALVYITKSNSSGGGGVRWYKQAGSSSVYIDGFVEEGAGQSQPVFEVMSNSGSLSATIQNVLIADSGDKPPAVRVPVGWPAGTSSVTVINARSGGIATQGPMTVINTVIANLTTVAGTTVPISSPAAQGQSGFSAGNAYNLQTDAARSNFSAAAVRFQNLASQSPAQWTTAEGTGVTLTNVRAPDGTQNAGLATCTAKGPSSICGIYVYNSSITFAAGDYVVAEVWVRAADHSSGPYTGFEGTLNLSGPTFSSTYYGTNANSSNRANASPMDDGAWQRVYIWVKVAGGGKVTTRMRLDFTPTQPTMFYAPAIYFFPGKQIAPPAAPVVSQNAVGSLAATIYYVRTTYVSGTGETVASAETSVAANTGNVISVVSPGAVPGATGWNVYMGNTASCPGVDAGAMSGAGQQCEVKQNAAPLSIGTDWTEPITGRVAYSGWYTGSMGPAGETEPTNDSTNAYGDSEIADFALNTQSVPADITGGPTVATMQGLNFAFGGSGDNYHAILDHTNLTANQTFIFPNQSGQVALSNVAQTWTAPQTFDAVNVNKATIGGETISSAPEAVFNAFLPGALDTPYAAATFSPQHGVIVERIVVTVKAMPQGCASNAVIRVSGTKTWDSVIASSLTDSGPVNLPMDLGASIQILLQTPAQGCGVAPQDANVAVHYRMQ